MHPQSLQTPYSEILDFLTVLSYWKPKTFVDVGAGYGRVAIVLDSVLPDTQFIGYEIVEQRRLEGMRMFAELGLTNCVLHSQNVLEDGFRLPNADVYFLYDFSDPPDIRQILKQLIAKIGKDRFFIVARGQGIRSMIQLQFPQIWAARGAIHKKNWSLYSSFIDLS